MVITSSIVYVSTSKVEEAEERRFFRQFHLDMQQLQSIAIGETKFTHIKFDENGTKYIGAWRDTSTVRIQITEAYAPFDLK